MGRAPSTKRRVEGEAPPPPPTIGGVQPFHSNYERITVAFKCRACSVIFWPKLFGDNECPFCGSDDTHDPLISAFRPAQDPHQRVAAAKKFKEEAWMVIPPAAWQNTWAPTDKTPQNADRMDMRR
jgi:hypothetical protein